MILKGQRYKAREDFVVHVLMSTGRPYTIGRDRILKRGGEFVVLDDPPPGGSAAYCALVLTRRARREDRCFVLQCREFDAHCELVAEPPLEKCPALGRFEGCLLGLMAGDSLGLPRENLTPERAERLLGPELRHQLFFGRGMGSDDTELACFTAQAFLTEPWVEEDFARALAWKLRFWLLGLPAGLGLATLRATVKLWFGFPPERSGVFSAGNGAAIRAPVLGLACWDDEEKLRAFVRVSSRLTHTDPRAERGALAVALAARYAATHGPEDFSVAELLAQLKGVFPEEDVEGRRWLSALNDGFPEFAAKMGFEDGVSGYVYHTVPAALWAWLASPFDFEGGMRRVIALGGDTDTTGAIYGGLCGAAAGAEAIPPAWLDGIADFPRSVGWVRRLAARLHAAVETDEPRESPFLFWPLLPLRNAFFLAVVLWHGVRRLARSGVLQLNSVRFSLIGALFIYLGLERLPAGWLLVWAGSSFVSVGAVYALSRPALFGKRPDGSLAMWAWLPFGPHFFFTWLSWQGARLLGRERCCDEVSPGLWVGRRPYAGELPGGIGLVVDLTSEFPVASGVGVGRSYVCLPVLDGSAASYEELAATVEMISSWRKGGVYVHCAIGHGRSALFAAAVLIRRGLHSRSADAVAAIKRARPKVGLSPAQTRLLDKFASRSRRV